MLTQILMEFIHRHVCIESELPADTAPSYSLEERRAMQLRIEAEANEVICPLCSAYQGLQWALALKCAQ